MFNLTIKEIQKLYASGELKPKEYFAFIKNEINKIKDKNYFITTCFVEAENELKKIEQTKMDFERFPLWGIPYSLKDNVITKDIVTTAACKILVNYTPDRSAYLCEKLQASKALLVGKNNLDELGMEGSGLFSPFGVVKNPWNPKKIIGGSSSGSAGIVAEGILPFAIGTDTGDSIRQPAVYCGLVGFKPSWNRISRCGVIPYTPSLDTVGVMARTVEDASIPYLQMQGFDRHDATSYRPFMNEKWNYPASIKKLKIFYLKDLDNVLSKSENKHIKENFEKQIAILQAQGAVVEPIEFGIEYLKALLAMYNIISYAESTSCQAYLQGITHGNTKKHADWEKHIFDVRTDGFTKKTKDRQLIGSYYLSASNREKYFDRAKKVRRLIINKLDDLFKKYDAFISPIGTDIPDIHNRQGYKRDISDAYNLLNDHILLANFAGLPSISLPTAMHQGMPVSIIINSKIYTEDVCLSIAQVIENHSGLKNLSVRKDSYGKK